MIPEAERLLAFLQTYPHPAVVEVTEAKGSTPREKGALMLISPSAIVGTIGGGQLEFLAVARARELIAGNAASGMLDIPLGPELGQCCGGRVALDIAMADETRLAELVEEARKRDEARPHVYVFGAGHVGKALVTALSPLPLRAILVDSRPEAFTDIAEGVEQRAVAMPESLVRDAPPGSAFVVLTHEHSLDFMIVREALARGDAAYVGMIGSKTKRATFVSGLKREGDDPARAEKLTCPIGGSDVRDKRPEVIAALVAAELVRALFTDSSA